MLSGSLSNLLLFKMADIDEIQEKKKSKTQFNYKIDYLKQTLIDHTQIYFPKNHVNSIKIDKAVNYH